MKKSIGLAVVGLLLIGAVSVSALDITVLKGRGAPDAKYTNVYCERPATVLAEGDVVIWDFTAMNYGTATDTSRIAVTVTTTADDARVAGVVVGEDIDTDSGWCGKIQTWGYCDKVDVLAVSDTTTANSLIGTAGTATKCGGYTYSNATDRPLGIALESSVSGTDDDIKAFLLCD